MLHKTEFSISIDHHYKIIRHKHAGLIQLENLTEIWKELLGIEEFTKHKYNLLSDLRNARIELSSLSIYHIVEKMESVKSLLEQKRHSLIIDDPHTVALAMLFMDAAIQRIGIKIDIFSTENAAITWLLH